MLKNSRQIVIPVSLLTDNWLLPVIQNPFSHSRISSIYLNPFRIANYHVTQNFPLFFFLVFSNLFSFRFHLLSVPGIWFSRPEVGLGFSCSSMRHIQSRVKIGLSAEPSESYSATPP